MRIKGLIWLEEYIDKLEHKHQLTQEEVREIFKNQPRFRYVEKGAQEGENVYVAKGQTEAGRYVSVFFIYKKTGWALVISAREMKPKEKKRYEKR
ncbi:MAG: hypothetical protein A3G34_04875 [Candidatus Lindowbacteria bacterium RIFCSPLOWO2_12_FULL_62_27]|nr:MAG: hypothetical protein A3I06_13195 [Candidatus Lindowbacteria bacterium RIFCSPLOWO2_02_FULL_62_12]OGH61331.1 MAG: hypothetical protein A3G34_04875 [Candidatus Lindowbacteria bacterium RIFCSPLOWO2_12_FULL_62_27]